MTAEPLCPSLCIGSSVVKHMKTAKPLRKDTLVSKLLRAVGKDRGFESPLPSQEEKHIGVSAYYPDYHRELINAALEAENHKAMATMDYQKRNLPR